MNRRRRVRLRIYLYRFVKGAVCPAGQEEIDGRRRRSR